LIKKHILLSQNTVIHDMLWDDADAILKGDPAAEV